MTGTPEVDSPAAKPCLAAPNTVPQVPGCEVIEYDEPTGQQEWSDSLFVQDFTDSVLATNPAPLFPGALEPSHTFTGKK
jgi:hypothetical protein